LFKKSKINPACLIFRTDHPPAALAGPEITATVVSLWIFTVPEKAKDFPA
jgi:hypothetical protein